MFSERIRTLSFRICRNKQVDAIRNASLKNSPRTILMSSEALLHTKTKSFGLNRKLTKLETAKTNKNPKYYK